MPVFVKFNMAEFSHVFEKYVPHQISEMVKLNVVKIFHDDNLGPGNDAYLFEILKNCSLAEF